MNKKNDKQKVYKKVGYITDELCQNYYGEIDLRCGASLLDKYMYQAIQADINVVCSRLSDSGGEGTRTSQRN